MTRYLVNDQAQLALKYESGTYGVATGGGVWIGLVQDHSISESREVMPLRFVAGATRSVEQFQTGPTTFTGTFNYYPQDFRILKFALGKCADAGSPSPYTHTYTEANSTDTAPEFASQVLPSFTLEDAHIYATGSNFIRTVSGAVIDSFSLSATPGQPLSCAVNYVAQNVGFCSGAKTSITDPALAPFMWQPIAVHIPSGTAYNNITSFNFSVNNSLSPQQYIESGLVINSIIPGNREYE